jgi:anti-sigma B factor antagonist
MPTEGDRPNSQQVLWAIGEARRRRAQAPGSATPTIPGHGPPHALAGPPPRPGRPGPARRVTVPPGGLDVTLDGDPAHQVVHLVGELDIASAPCLRTHLRRLAAGGAHEVEVELDELEFMDASGLAALLDGRKWLRHQGGDLVLVSPTAPTRRLLRLTGLVDVFSVVG